MRYTFLSACLLLGLASCSKSNNDNKTTPVKEANLAIDGITDITVKQDSVNYLVLQVKNLDSQEKVSLSTGKLPEHVSVSFSAASGIPLFGSVVSFSAAFNADTGSYPIVITGTTASGSSKDYNLNLHVAYKPTCAATVAGNYNDSYSCDGGLHGTTTELVSADPSTTDKIMITTPAAGSFYALSDCITHTLTIPKQTSSTSVTVSGSGSFTDNSVSVIYTASGNKCSDALSRK